MEDFSKLPQEVEKQVLFNLRLFCQFRSSQATPPVSDFYKAIQHLVTSILWSYDQILSNSKKEISHE